MMPSFTDPFEALFSLQRALDARRASDWLGGGTAAMGSYPPINVFQQGDDFVAVVELPGVDKADLQIEAKENTIRISGKRASNYPDGSVHRRERDPAGPRGRADLVLVQDRRPARPVATCHHRLHRHGAGRGRELRAVDPARAPGAHRVSRPRLRRPKPPHDLEPIAPRL